MHSDFMIACASLKLNREALGSVKAHMIANDWWKPDAAKPKEKKSQLLARGKDDNKVIPDDQLQHIDELKVEIHRNFVTWEKCPPQHIRVLLQYLRPLEFSKANLLDLRCRGQREVPRNILLPYLERETGIDPTEEIGDDRQLWKLVVELRRAAKEQGCPCEGMVLPAQWTGNDGVWQIGLDDGRWTIYDGATLKQVDPAVPHSCICCNCFNAVIWGYF